jgi:hypothetical protein
MRTVLDHLASKFEEEIGRLNEHAGSGQCKDFSEYANVCGQIRGLKSALNTTSDLARQEMENDDD